MLSRAKHLICQQPSVNNSYLVSCLLVTIPKKVTKVTLVSVNSKQYSLAKTQRREKVTKVTLFHSFANMLILTTLRSVERCFKFAN